MPTTKLREPKQARSRATLGRICDAAIRLLETRDWHEIPVADIAHAARSSVGAFYVRFPDKEALLDHLDERYTADVLGMGTACADQRVAADLDLEALVALMVERLVQFHRRRQGLIRALVLRARMYREPAYEERTKRMNLAVAETVNFLSERLPEKLGDQRPRRAFLAFSFMFSALRDRILFPESIADPDPARSDEELAKDLACAMIAHLSAPPERSARFPGDSP